VQLKPGDVFSREKLAASTKAISDRLGNEAMHRQHQRHPQPRQGKRSVSFNIVIDPGRRVYVRASTSPATPRPATR